MHAGMMLPSRRLLNTHNHRQYPRTVVRSQDGRIVMLVYCGMPRSVIRILILYNPVHESPYGLRYF